MSNWDFSLNKAANAEWTEGLREIFEYRDLGIKEATKGDYIAHIVKANGKEMKDEVQHWHVHDCDHLLDGDAHDMINTFCARF